MIIMAIRVNGIPSIYQFKLKMVGINIISDIVYNFDLSDIGEFIKNH